MPGTLPNIIPDVLSWANHKYEKTIFYHPDRPFREYATSGTTH